MPQETDDRRLIARIAGRDQAAFRVLVQRHQLHVYRFLLRVVRNEAVAEELANEVFMEVWRNARRFEGNSALKTWVLSIAHHRALSSLRKRREEPWNEELAHAIAEDADNPEVAAQKQDKSAVIRRCMNALSAEHREIVDLVYYHELSIAEAAAVVGIPENTVKTRMFYARKRLSELLASAGVDREWP
jgi:RNA polymerase sigma-70 factor (ECF subfamily)